MVEPRDGSPGGVGEEGIARATPTLRTWVEPFSAPVVRPTGGPAVDVLVAGRTTTCRDEQLDPYPDRLGAVSPDRTGRP